MTYGSLSHFDVSLEEVTAYLLPAWDKNNSKAVTTHHNWASFQLGKDASPAQDHFLSLSGSLPRLTRQHFYSLCYLWRHFFPPAYWTRILPLGNLGISDFKMQFQKSITFLQLQSFIGVCVQFIQITGVGN